MATIKAPFNFVPLSDKVYFPEWADQISQDIPFEDGVSGTIELKITAQTPIFVRNGHTKEDGEEKNETYKSFSKDPNGKYFIPGTSIKGCIRSVLEIMSFGKMRLDKTAKFSQREWDNETLYPLKKRQNGFHCGWICPDGDNYKLYDCGKPMRIAMDKIDQYTNSKVMFNHFSKEKGIDLTKEQQIDGETYDPKTAAYKYKLLEKHNLENLTFDYDGEYCNEFKDNRLAVSRNGEFKGTIVLTGQPDKFVYPRPRKLTKGAGKFYEFVFLDNDGDSYSISKEDFDHYKFIYSDSPDWKLAVSRLDKGGIPVFFRLEDGKVKDFGLAFLYKLPYDKSPFDTLGKDHREEKPDLADCIFGYVDNKNALRGRVQFSSAVSGNASIDNQFRLALGSPKASYYPIYIRQNGQKNVVAHYQTYNDGKISGWKRYLVRADAFERNTGDDKIDTFIYPLKKGTEFVEKIRFHNLKRVELGALLSAITFHNTPECFHQLGQGKPYGFGKVSIQIDKLRVNGQDENALSFMTDFEEMLFEEYNKSWVNNEQIVQLFTMAHVEVTSDDVYDYMRMSTDSDDNEFLVAKMAKEYLDVYTSLSLRKYPPTSLYEPQRLAILKAKEEKASHEKFEEVFLAYQTKLSEIDLDALNSPSDCDVALSQIEQSRLKYESLLLDFPNEVIEDKHSVLMENIKAKKIILIGDIGLSILQDKNLNNEFNVKTLKDMGNRIDQTRKKCDWLSIPETEFEHIYVCLKRVYSSLKERDKNREWNGFDSRSWRQIIFWVGEETARQWFDELNA